MFFNQLMTFDRRRDVPHRRQQYLLFILGLALALTSLASTASAQTATLDGLVWMDRDGDELFGAEEPPLAGVTVELVDGSVVVASDVTAVDGTYSMFGLASGSFVLRVDGTTLPRHLQGTYEAGGAVDGSIPLTLVDGESLPDLDWGFWGSGAVAGFVFDDINGDGEQDHGDAGLQGAVLTLTDAEYGFVYTTTSDFDGSYLMSGFPNIPYTLSIDPVTVPGYNAVSEPDPVIDHQTFIDLEPIVYETNLHFGFNSNAVIEGRIFLDLDPLASLDPTDMGLVGVTILLYDDMNNPLGSTDTFAAGAYRFDNLVPGTYRVWVDSTTLPFGLLHTYDPDGNLNRQETRTVSAAEVVSDIDFGFTGNTSIGDQVLFDLDANGFEDPGDAGLADILLTLTDLQTQETTQTLSQSGGSYLFNRLYPGAYRIVVDPSTVPVGLSPVWDRDGTLDYQTEVTTTYDESVLDADFSFNGSGMLAGVVFSDGDSSGSQEAGEPGLTAVGVTLLGEFGSYLDDVSTASDGSYQFGDLGPGTYGVLIDTFTLPSSAVQTADPDSTLDGMTQITVAIGEQLDDLDFGYLAPGGVFGGVFQDANGDGSPEGAETGLTDVRLELFDDQGGFLLAMLTDMYGNYQFDDLEAGEYTVIVDLTTLPPGSSPTFDSDGLGTPNEVTFTVIAGEVAYGINFGYVGAGGVYGAIKRDSDFNGYLSPDDGWLESVRVVLLDSEGTTQGEMLTQEYGNFYFENLAPGDYSVYVDESTLPENFTPAWDYDGLETPHASSFSVTAEVSTTDVIFGYRPPAEFYGGVYIDSDMDGQFSPDDGRLESVRVVLLDSEGMTQGEMLTDEYGGYYFDNLLPDLYWVYVDESTLPENFTQVWDYDGLETPHAAEISLLGVAWPEVTFGYQGPGDVYGRVLHDQDLNGEESEGDTGLGFIRVVLQDSEGMPQGEVLTNEYGDFYFDNLLPGDYLVYLDESTLPENFTQVWDYDGLETPHAADFSITAGQTTSNVTFGYQGPGDVYGRVLHDQDLNGEESEGDTGLGFIRVVLQDSEGMPQGEVLTNEYGDFYFDNLLPGDYLVYLDESTLPENFTQVWDYDGLETPHAADFSITAGQTTSNVTFGYQGPGDVYGRVLHDQDLNGEESEGDSGLQNIRVVLQDSEGMPQGEVLTNEYGDFYFDNLLPGDYLVYLDESTLPENFTQVWDYDGLETPHAADFSITAGQTTSNVTFGYQGPGDVYGRVLHDQDLNGEESEGDSGLQNIRVVLQDSEGMPQGEVLTNEYGDFYFDNLLPGDYLVYLDESTLPENFTQVWDYDGLETPHAADFSITAGQTTSNVTFGYQGPGDVYGRVLHDQDLNGEESEGDSGLQNIRVVLQDSEGMPQGEVLTNEYGDFYFDNLLPGDYLVYLDESTLPENFTQVWDYDGLATPHAADFSITAGQTTSNVTFGYQGPGDVYGGVYHDVNSDGIRSPGDLSLQNVRVILMDSGGGTLGEQLTDEYGLFIFYNLLPGNYSVVLDESTLPENFTPSWDYDGTVTPHTADFSVSAGQVTEEVTFGYVETGAVHGQVLLDADLDGTPSGDVAIESVDVWLDDSSGTPWAVRTTDVLGKFFFDLVPSGIYTVRVDAASLPAATSESYDNDGTLTLHEVPIAVIGGQTTSGIQFGYFPPASLAGGVYEDVNGNNVPDSNDLGWRGARVELLDDQGSALAETTTDSYGLYRFELLLPGTYSVRVDASTLPDGYLPTFDPDGAATAHEASTVIAAGTQSTAFDFGYRQSADPTWLAHWTLDDPSGGVSTDSTGSGHDGAWGNGVLPVAGLFANGLSFDGQNDVVEVPASAALDSLSEVTLSAWVRHDGTGGWRSIIDKRDTGSDGFDLYISDASQAFLRINDQTLTASGALAADTWIHLVGTYDGDEMALFVDGVEAATRNIGAQTLDTTGSLLLGENYARGNSYFSGVLDDVRLYSRALSAAEIAELTQAAATVVDTAEPTLAQGGPSGTLAAETTDVALTLITGEEATCRYSEVFDVDFDAMGGSFETPDGTSHSQGLNGLEAGNYAYFVRCEDLVGNQNTVDYVIEFSIAEPGSLDQGLVAYWAMDEGSGTAVSDASGFDAHGTLINGPQWTAGWYGSGLLLDGVDDAMTVGSSPALDSLSQVTLSAWIQVQPGGGWRSILDKRDVASDGYDLYLDNTSKLFMRVNQHTLSGQTNVADGAWHHVVGIYDGQQVLLYVDGTLEATGTVGSLSLDTWRALRLGENWSQGNSYFGGLLDEVRIYDRPLSPLDVIELYQSSGQP